MINPIVTATNTPFENNMNALRPSGLENDEHQALALAAGVGQTNLSQETQKLDTIMDKI